MIVFIVQHFQENDRFRVKRYGHRHSKGWATANRGIPGSYAKCAPCTVLLAFPECDGWDKHRHDRPRYSHTNLFSGNFILCWVTGRHRGDIECARLLGDSFLEKCVKEVQNTKTQIIHQDLFDRQKVNRLKSAGLFFTTLLRFDKLTHVSLVRHTTMFAVIETYVHWLITRGLSCAWHNILF